MRSLADILKGVAISKGGSEVSFLDQQKAKDFLNKLLGVSIIYRYVGDKRLNVEYGYDTNRVEILSKHLFLYGDKGKLFYDELKQKADNNNFAVIYRKNFEFIYKKLYKILVNTGNLRSIKTRNQISKLDNLNEFQAYFMEVTIEDWCNEIEKLNDTDKTILKNYYLSFLHTVGSAGFGSNSYFLSTSLDYNFCREWYDENEAEYGEKGIIIAGWTSKGSVIKTFSEKNKQRVQRLGFPVFDSQLFPDQKEVTLMCGLLPQYIIGYFYRDKFEINPYILNLNINEDISSIVENGLPVDQKDFMKCIHETGLKYYYSVCDGFSWQHDLS